MQNADLQNGTVICQSGFTTMYCPVYAPNPVEMTLETGLNLHVKAYQLNGNEIPMVRKANGLQQSAQVRLEQGWNWISVDVKRILKSELVFFQIFATEYTIER